MNDVSNNYRKAYNIIVNAKNELTTLYNKSGRMNANEQIISSTISWLLSEINEAQACIKPMIDTKQLGHTVKAIDSGFSVKFTTGEIIKLSKNDLIEVFIKNEGWKDSKICENNVLGFYFKIERLGNILIKSNMRIRAIKNIDI